MGEYLLDGTQRLFGAEAGVGNSLNWTSQGLLDTK
jgi:hypothetical protein